MTIEKILEEHYSPGVFDRVEVFGKVSDVKVAIVNYEEQYIKSYTVEEGTHIYLNHHKEDVKELYKFGYIPLWKYDKRCHNNIRSHHYILIEKEESEIHEEYTNII